MAELALLAARVVGGRMSCGIAARTDHGPVTVASSDLWANQLDGLQFAEPTGPCLRVLNTGEPVQINDLARRGRWSAFESRAVAHRLRSMLSMPMVGDGQILGALNLYSADRASFTDGQLQSAARFADRAAGVLGLAGWVAAHTSLSDHPRRLLESRAVIDQAIGVLMARHRCGPEQAAAVLRADSQDLDISRHVIAATIVAGIQQPPNGSRPRPPDH